MQGQDTYTEGTEYCSYYYRASHCLHIAPRTECNINCALVLREKINSTVA